MNKLLETLKRLVFLPPVPTLIFAVIGFGLIISVAAFDIQIPAVQYLSYFLSAYALTVTITGFKYITALFAKIKNAVLKSKLMSEFKKTSFGGKYYSNVRFRTTVSLYIELLINVLYIIMKLVSGIVFESVWFIALAVYYILLAGMRLILARHTDSEDVAKEWKLYRACGVILLIMNITLAVIVVFIVFYDKGFDYPGLLIYAVALYSFYSVISAVISVVKYRRHKSPVLSSAKIVKFVAAVVSMLSLTTAMISQFGSDDAEFRIIMTSAVGIGVCVIVVVSAGFMIIRANINLKNIKSP